MKIVHPITPISNQDTLFKSAQRVLNAEGNALHQIAQSLDNSFIQAVDLILNCKGRVVITGMGKSGHVARKIAATLASTGTPAFFVHPGEASHGDLGMIIESDIILALSNSGEAVELNDLINYSRRFSIPLIALTSKKESTLAISADTTLLLPLAPEVCPMGLAPTTSTTMMMALGDALAIAVMEQRGFTADDYRNFHPGGKLGKTLLRVADIMHKDQSLPLARMDDRMDHVLVVMTEKSFGCAGIIDASGHLQGIITDGDLRRHMDQTILTKKAGDVMTANPMVTSPKVLAAEALKILNQSKRTNLFVVEDGKPIGILHIHDLLRSGIA